MTFNDIIQAFFKEFGDSKKMVLSTSANDKVTSRMMSIILLEGCFYFQTDKNFRKYAQIKENPNVALCIDNVQIEGICHELGHPMENNDFCRLYEKCFKSSYDRYTSMKNERLFKIEPKYIQKWVYENSIPYIEKYRIDECEYEKIMYEAILYEI